jgi:hypothetical protein
VLLPEGEKRKTLGTAIETRKGKLQTVWASLGCCVLFLFGNQLESTLSLLFLAQPKKFRLENEKEKTIFLKVIKFYDFFMCFAVAGAAFCLHDMLFSRPYSID